MSASLRFTRSVAAAATLLFLCASAAGAAEKLTYLFPAPETLPAFSPYQVAKAKGYYEAEGIDVTFQVGKGGADVAKQVALGNAELGAAIGDTPVIVRANGLPVKIVAMLGGQALTQIIIRKDAGAADITQLKGKSVGVMAFQDTTYYNLLGALAAVDMTKDDVDVQSVGPAGVVQLMISGDLDAISGVPEWDAAIKAAGVETVVQPINDLFPAMAQVILASDDTIAEKPELVQGFVRATLKGLKDVMTDPAGSSALLAKTLPAFEGKQAMLEGIMRSYGTLVYAFEDEKDFGMVDPDRLAAVQDFYVTHGIINASTPLDDLYTNEFVD